LGNLSKTFGLRIFVSGLMDQPNISRKGFKFDKSLEVENKTRKHKKTRSKKEFYMSYQTLAAFS
jgi:hypothetical protein